MARRAAEAATPVSRLPARPFPPSLPMTTPLSQLFYLRNLRFRRSGGSTSISTIANRPLTSILSSLRLKSSWPRTSGSSLTSRDSLCVSRSSGHPFYNHCLFSVCLCVFHSHQSFISMITLCPIWLLPQWLFALKPRVGVAQGSSGMGCMRDEDICEG